MSLFLTPFEAVVCEGDTITARAGVFNVTAVVMRDDNQDSPDQRQDGFWPSLVKSAPGFIGPGPNHRDRFGAAMAEAEAIMAAWRADEWFYGGLVLSVALEGVTLAPHAASLWGVEVNYPGTKNEHLTEVAGELLPEALSEARRILGKLKEAARRDSP